MGIYFDEYGGYNGFHEHGRVKLGLWGKPFTC